MAEEHQRKRPERRRTVFADILKPKSVEAEEAEPARAPLAPKREKEAPKAKSPKLNKAINPEYMKLTAYIPRDLHFEIKTAIAAGQETDQSAYIKRWLRESLKRRQSATSAITLQRHSDIELYARKGLIWYPHGTL